MANWNKSSYLKANIRQGGSMTQQIELAAIVSLVLWYTLWAALRRPRFENEEDRNGV